MEVVMKATDASTSLPKQQSPARQKETEDSIKKVNAPATYSTYVIDIFHDVHVP